MASSLVLKKEREMTLKQLAERELGPHPVLGDGFECGMTSIGWLRR
ncbi:hypothetical protein OH492_02355 [Vibrio chagasii]|nr:hypothetical protein [Vibrio chagasii]